MKLTYGSVCSGIEAASVAWESLKMKPEWFSEIEPFPCAVLSHHWPEVKNLGDMTTITDKLKAGEVTAPDVLVGGTPCQAFSVAGLRGGLSDERGQLTLSFVELADCIDEIREKDGKEPAIIVWENVPGVLSSKDNAFGCFLAGLTGESEELKPTGEKWSNAGVVSGPQRTISWRILDAQYFGVPQRRRRVFVVATARKDISVAKILFERESLSGGVESRSEEKQTVAALTANGVGATGADDNQALAGHLIVDPLDTQCGYEKHSMQSVALGHIIAFNPQAGGKTSATLGANSHTVSCIQASQQPAILLAGNIIGRKPENGGNQTGYSESDISYTLTKIDVPGVSVNNIVRRLTPIECERLQGFPDNHTKVPFKDKVIDDCPDGHRYRALGNSMAVPVMRWIGERICSVVAQAIPQSDYVKKLNALKLQSAHELKEVGDQWRTPEELFWGINAIYGPFTLDLFTDGQNSKCPHFYTAEDNALTQDWSAKLKEIGGVAFGNPPYSRSSYHEKQAITGVRHIMSHASVMRDLGGRYVFLLKAATSEVWWPENADHVCFIRGRLGFELPEWFNPADETQVPSGARFSGAIVVFDKTWTGKAFDYISREELEQRGKAFIEQAQWLVKKMGVAA
ncbi:phage N-6-adenine-methyltransferase [Providencia rettgeri]|uniref:phage N-6-adenine-methyltransferase n=1 Tax=Providencia rettgeri TaxID=587 RepID=UPI00301927E7